MTFPFCGGGGRRVVPGVFVAGWCGWRPSSFTSTTSPLSCHKQNQILEASCSRNMLCLFDVFLLLQKFNSCCCCGGTSTYIIYHFVFYILEANFFRDFKDSHQHAESTHSSCNSSIVYMLSYNSI